MTSKEIKGYSLAQIEELYISPYSQEKIPSGTWKGTMLTRIDSKGGNDPFNRLWQGFLFDFLPYGLWFNGQDQGAWHFVFDFVRLGEFTYKLGRSRFRDSEVFKITYENARLPKFFKDIIYDEVRWISKDLLLGMGAMNEELGIGDQFYFLLEKID